MGVPCDRFICSNFNLRAIRDVEPEIINIAVKITAAAYPFAKANLLIGGVGRITVIINDKAALGFAIRQNKFELLYVGKGILPLISAIDWVILSDNHII